MITTCRILITLHCLNSTLSMQHTYNRYFDPWNIEFRILKSQIKLFRLFFNMNSHPCIVSILLSVVLLFDQDTEWNQTKYLMNLQIPHAWDDHKNILISEFIFKTNTVTLTNWYSLYFIYRMNQKNFPFAHFWVFEHGRGVFRGKNNSKSFENQKIIGCLAKFWVNQHCLS